MVRSFLILVFVSMAMCSVVVAEGLRAGRYVSVTDKSASSIFLKPVMFHFPESVNTTQDAMRYMLRSTGYRLVSHSSLSLTANAMLATPLPAQYRLLSAPELQQALQRLAGNAFQLLLDPVHHQIGFQLKPHASVLYTHSAGSKA